MLYSFAVSMVRVINFIFYGFIKPDNSSVPKEGGVIVCSNHPGLHDPIFLATALSRRLTFMAKKELFQCKPFGALIKALGAFPVDRYNNDLSAVKNAIRLLKGGNALLIFPQGKRSFREENVSGKHGAVRLAIMTGAPIVPVGISEKYHIFKKLRVRLGEPLDYTKYKGQHLTEEDYDALTEDLMNTIYALSEGKKP